MQATRLVHSQRPRGQIVLQRALTATRGLKTGAGTAKPVKRRRKLQPKGNKGKADLTYPYNLNPVDYTKPPPIAPTLIPPPPKGGGQRWLIVGSMLAFAGFGVFLYFNSDSETYEYWKKVETGENIMGDDDDDYDEDYDEDDEE